MANLFDNLPLPVGNGPGAAVDVSGMGRDKTFIVDGTFPGATIMIEISNDGGVTWAPLVSFQTGSTKSVVPCAAQFMRTNVSGRMAPAPFSASVNVGGNDAGGLFVDLPVPPGNGNGASVNVASFGQFATFIVGGTFPNIAVSIEASDDDVNFTSVCQFTNKGGQKSVPQTVNYYRTVVSGKSTEAFAATAAVGAVNDGGGGGGGGGGGTDIVLNNDSAGPLLSGMAVYSSSDGGVNKADAAAQAKATVVGLVVPQPGIPLGGGGAIRTSGPLTLPAAAWDLVTGGSGGLTVNVPYYLDYTTPGNLSLTPPTSPTQDGDFVAPIGTAVSSMTLIIRIEENTQL